MPNSRREIPDGGSPGLYLIVQPSGKKSWAMRYRYGGRSGKLTLGTVNVEDSVTPVGERPGLGGYLTLAEARMLAADHRHMLVQGIDPKAVKAATVATLTEAKAETERLRVRNVATKFLRDYVHGKGLRTGGEVERQFRVEILPQWGERQLTAISKRDVNALLDGIVDRGSPIMANRILATISKFMNWCIARDYIAVSPALGVERRGAENNRDRILTDTEVAAMWHASEIMGEPFGRVFQMLLLTGQRRDEVAGMSSVELDLDSCVWTIPGRRTKNGSEHVVPLSSLAAETLSRVRLVQGKAGLLFTTNGRTAVSGFSRAKGNLDRLTIRVASKNLPHWTLHDLRRTAASGMARLGVQVHVVEAILNHRTGKIRGVAAVYNRYDYASEKKSALELWGEHVRQLVGAARSTHKAQ